jgi:HlyD family secretion protein
MKASSKWLLSATLAAGMGAGLFYYFRSGEEAGPSYQTAVVDRGRIVARLMAAGTLSPLVTVQVGSQVSGRIKGLSADFNSRVKKGQVIARIDPQIFDAAVEQAKANLLAAEANLAKARVQADDAERQSQRSQALAARKLVAPADQDTARANAAAAAAQVKAMQGALAQTRAALNQARINLAYTTIVSPISGVVISRSVDVGQTVAASLQAPTLFTIAEDLAKMQVDTNVAEADIGRVKDGMAITFGVDAYPREQFSGAVRQIRNAPQTVQNVVTYDVVIDVANSDLRLKPGMTANVTFIYAETEAVLRVPNAALRFRPTPEMLALVGAGSGKPDRRAGRRPRSGDAEGSVHLASAEAAPSSPHQPTSRPSAATRQTSDVRQVWVLRRGVPTPLSIHVGISDGTKTEILGGPMQEGDQVLLDATGESGGAGPKGFGGPHGRGIIRRL